MSMDDHEKVWNKELYPYPEDKTEIKNLRMSRILEKLTELGWEKTGEGKHPIDYPNACQVKKDGKKVLYIAPALEDYRCITIWDERKRLAIVNTITMMLINSEKDRWPDTDMSVAQLEVLR